MSVESFNLTYSGLTEDLDTNIAVMSDYDYENIDLVSARVPASVFEEVRNFSL